MLNTFIQILPIVLNVSTAIIAISLTVLLVLIFIKNNKNSGINNNLEDFYNKVRNDIQNAVTPKFLELSVGVNEMVNLAVEFWRIEQRVLKLAESLPEEQMQAFRHSIQKMKREIDKFDIEIIDYKNQKFNNGLSVDVLSEEIDDTLSDPIIKETVEPTVLFKGQVVRRAKIIKITNR